MPNNVVWDGSSFETLISKSSGQTDIKTLKLTLELSLDRFSFF